VERKVAVVSAAQTKYGKSPVTARELALTAAADCIDQAGADPKEIGLGVVANCFGVVESQAHLAPILMTQIGNPSAPSFTVESACSSGGSALHIAFAGVRSGLYDTVLCVGVERVTHLPLAKSTEYFSMGSDYSFEGCCGATFPGLYAVMARAHMHERGTKSEDLAAVAVKNHENASMNPKAHLQKRITVDEVLASPLVADPLHFFDCCPFSDGAAAILVTTEEKARKMGGESVEVAASVRTGGPAALQSRERLDSLDAARRAAGLAYRQARITPKDVGFAEVHDCFTIAEVMAIEDLGLVGAKEAPRAAAEGITARDGAIPVNASGGLKAKGHPVGATGLGQVVEVFDQMLARAGTRQVPRSDVGLTHNVGATGGSCAVHVFKRMR
jgi:acetyl-CoA C-acetyltransferase